jgi:acetyl esterase/lipase
LQRYANATGKIAISVGYRLAPENPFPAAIEDCIDVGEYLVMHGRKKFGADLEITVGDVRHLFFTTTFPQGLN